MSKRIILGTVLLTVTFFSLLWFFWPSEEDRIREQFDELSCLVSKTEDSSPISDALALKNFSSLFCEEIVLETGNTSRLKENTRTKNWFGTMEGSDLTPRRSIFVLKFCSLFPWIMKGPRYPFGFGQERLKRHERSTLRTFRQRFFCEKGKESGGSPPLLIWGRRHSVSCCNQVAIRHFERTLLCSFPE